MTDQEIIKGLIERDECVTKDFFFVKCKPLFYSIINIVFDYEVEYDELVNELAVLFTNGSRLLLSASSLRNEPE